MEAIIQSLLQFLVVIEQGLGQDQITKWINFLIVLVPSIQAEYSDLAPEVDNIIAALKDQTEATPEQVAILTALESTSDTDYDSALAAFNAAHPVAA